MKLYYSPGACALASQIVLREAGLNFDLVKVDLKERQVEGGDYRTTNPKGYVPAILTDAGDLFTEGAVILQWISDQVPDKKLLPKFGTRERYKAMEWLNFIATELHKGIGAFMNKSLTDEARAPMNEKLQRRLTFVNDHLAENAYLLGSEFSAADAYIYNILRWAAPLKIDLSPYKSILGLMERVSLRPSVKAAIEAEGLKH